MELEDVLKNFPYFNQAHMLLAKAHHDKGSMFALQRIRRAAVYAQDRNQFSDFVETPLVLSKNRVSDNTPSTLQQDMQVVAAIRTPIEAVTLTESAQQAFLENQDQENLLSEVESNLKSFLDAKKKFDDSTFSGQNSDLDASTLDEGAKKKTEVKSDFSSEDEHFTRKVYIHHTSFGKDIRAVDDAVSEYLKFRELSKPVVVDAQLQQEIIQRFLSEKADAAKITPAENVIKSDLSKSSTVLDDSIVTESYANMLLKQGKKEKAIEVFEKLSLKYPDKSTYFAARIEEVRNNL